jgi:hypothetical protein
LLFAFTPVNSISKVSAAPNERGYFHTITPARLYYSSPSAPTSIPLGRDGTFTNGQARSYCARSLVGIGGFATALVANVTVVVPRQGGTGAAAAGGRLNIYPRNSEDYDTIAVNWWYNGPWNINNHHIIGLDGAGCFTIKSRGTTDVIIDVFGYIDNISTGGGLYRPFTTRLYDSRANSKYRTINKTKF